MLSLKTICDCTDRWGGATLHPSVGVLDLQKSRMGSDVARVQLYCVLLTERCPSCCCTCGRRDDDFSYATLRCLSPGDVLDWSDGQSWPDRGFLLMFHPDLLTQTSLGCHMADYSFFAYRRDEALHLSCREAKTVGLCVDSIKEELAHPVDKHSATILARHIELLLDYCSRFYERQFITREKCIRQLLGRLDAWLAEGIASGQLGFSRQPQLAECAGEMGLSPAYLADLLRFSTGKNLAEHFQLMVVEHSRRLLLEPCMDARAVARQLGFPSVQQFSMLFRRVTGLAPNAWRMLAN